MVELEGWLPVLLAAVAAIAVARLLLRRSSFSSTLPTYGPFFLPPFVRGLLAVYRLGADEDAFLQGLKRDYGAAVYIPWPMKTTFVLSIEGIRSVYAAPRRVLNFYPIRREMQHTVFGAGPYWKDESIMDGSLFPLHARGMSKANLADSLVRVVDVLRVRVDELAYKVDKAPQGDVIVDLIKWTVETFYDATLAGFFGKEFLRQDGVDEQELYNAFNAFDKSFPIVASGMVPPSFLEKIPDVKKGREGFEVLTSTFERWMSDGFAGLDAGIIMVADMWASMANAPFMGVQLLLFLLQAPSDIRRDLLNEIDSSLQVPPAEQSTFSHFSQSFPLLTSCITETLRVGTSIFSARIVEEDFRIPAHGEYSEAIVPAGTRLLSAPRPHHLDDSFWDGTAKAWNGRRFFGAYANLARSVYGFGGGVSRCEGEHIAGAELKAFISLLFSAFEVELIPPPNSDNSIRRVEVIGGGGTALLPKRADGRVGMGAFQPAEGARFDMRVRRRRPLSS
uniref:FGENESH: predicted gene_8.150 protein n=1 Tax=Rhodotorula toruloides TaxID=5286 RepID=A0A0K3CFE4_RHOTO